MRYYSDVTQKLYESAAACDAAEKAFHEKQNRDKIEKERAAVARKEAADKVEKARQNMVSAQKAYKDALADFCGKYGSFHTTVKPSEVDNSLSGLLNILNIL